MAKYVICGEEWEQPDIERVVDHFEEIHGFFGDRDYKLRLRVRRLLLRYLAEETYLAIFEGDSSLLPEWFHESMFQQDFVSQIFRGMGSSQHTTVMMGRKYALTDSIRNIDSG